MRLDFQLRIILEILEILKKIEIIKEWKNYIDLTEIESSR